MTSLALTSIEKTVLYRKYCSQGMDPVDAGKRVKVMSEKLRDLVLKLQKEGKLSKEDINMRFKEEFAKLCEQAEAKRTTRRRRK